jgi:hypothetical protein
MPSLDVRSRLLRRRFSANTQSLSIKIIRPAQILAGSCQRAWKRVKSEERRLLLSSSIRLDSSGFTSNCSAGHLLKRQARTLIKVAAVYDHRSPCSLLRAAPPSFRNPVLFFKTCRSPTQAKWCKKSGATPFALRKHCSPNSSSRGRKGAKGQWNGFRASR